MKHHLIISRFGLALIGGDVIIEVLIPVSVEMEHEVKSSSLSGAETGVTEESVLDNVFVHLLQQGHVLSRFLKLILVDGIQSLEAALVQVLHVHRYKLQIVYFGCSIRRIHSVALTRLKHFSGRFFDLKALL